VLLSQYRHVHAEGRLSVRRILRRLAHARARDPVATSHGNVSADSREDRVRDGVPVSDVLRLSEVLTVLAPS
jgi:hypothetical protein